MENRYKILKQLPRRDTEIDELCDQLLEDLEMRESDALQRMKQVENLITGNMCFARALAQHFGMELPDGKPKCGHCSYCITKKRVVLPHIAPKIATRATIQPILDATEVRDDPRFLARVAFGIKSPRVGKLRLDKTKVFSSLEDYEFSVSWQVPC